MGQWEGLPPPLLARNGVEIVGNTPSIFTRPLLVMTREDKLWEAATDPRAAKSSRRLQRVGFIRQFLASFFFFFSSGSNKTFGRICQVSASLKSMFLDAGSSDGAHVRSSPLG